MDGVACVGDGAHGGMSMPVWYVMIACVFNSTSHTLQVKFGHNLYGY